MTVPLPAQGSRAWYPWATAITKAVNTGELVLSTTPEVMDDFSLQPDGPITGRTLLTGQTWATTGNATFVVAGGRLTDTASGAIATAAYAQAPTAATVSYMVGEFCFGPDVAADGSLAMLTTTDQYTWPAGGMTVPFHLAITPTGWICAVIDPVNGLIVTGSGTFATPLVQNDATYYSVEAIIDKANSAVLLRLPDTSTAVCFHALVGTTDAEWATWENYYNNASTESKVRFTRVAATSVPLGRDPHVAQLRSTILNVWLLGQKAGRALTKRSFAANYTVAAADGGDIVLHSTAATGITVTVPQDSAAPIGQDVVIPWRQYGAGQITFAAGTGATLVSRGARFKSAGQYAEGLLTKVAANTWLLSGDIST